MVRHRARVRRASAIQLLHRHVSGRPRGADRRAALSGRLRRHRRERADRRLLVADARAGADSHSREAARQLGDAGQGERHSRRVHASVRRRSTVSPTASSTTTWRAAPSSTSRRARGTGGPGQRSAVRTTSIRIPQTPRAAACLTDGQISTLQFIVLALRVRHAAGARRANVRHVGAQHRSLRQRVDPEHPLSRPGGCGRERADARASRRAGRHRDS